MLPAANFAAIAVPWWFPAELLGAGHVAGSHAFCTAQR
jgi:hypothetical protein